MTRSRSVFLVMLALAGCDCGRRAQSDSAPAELGVVWMDNGVEVVNREATYDFGPAIMGERVGKKLVIKNRGRGLLTLVSLERLEGDPVTVGETVAADAAFDVRFVPGQAVGATEEVELDMFFTPPHAKDPSLTEVAHYAKLTLRSEGPPNGEETATIVLKGGASAGTCLLPKSLDFGKVPVGERFQLSFTLQNRTPVPATANVGEAASASGDHLAFTVPPPKGEVPVPASGSTSITVEFAPTELRGYQATMKVRASQSCPEGEVSLLGEGADEVLSWTPSSIDYGYISTGTESVKAVTFTNLSKVPVTLRNIATQLADFVVVAPPGVDPGTLTIPGGNVPTQLSVACRPSSLGPRQSTVSFDTGLLKQPRGTVALSCYGGGPNITVMPRPTLNFGKVGATVVRKVTVLNSGTKPPNADPNGNLKLGSVGPSGPGELPFVSLVPKNGNTAPGEFSVGIPPTYDPAVGLEAVPGRNVVDLVVTLTPQSYGTKEAELTLYSNDPDEPEVTVRLTADFQQLPPCNWAATPAQLNFGLVTPPTYKDLPVTLTNRGQNAGDICYLSGIEIAAGSDPAYSLVGGPVDSKELQPGESMQLLVRVWPQVAVPSGLVTLSGFLQFNVSSPTQPQGLVPLQTSMGPVCLTIAPDNLDFGTVKKDCNSATRDFTIYNVCTQNVTLTSFSVQAGAAEFHLVSTPPIPTGGLTMTPGGAPVTFRARYHPLDFGPDSGAIAVNAIQSGQNVTYLVSVHGTGDANGLQTDVFVQDAKPKADILLTIDDSCSMSDKQNSLANNFSSFIQYAQAANVDYHIGVTTTDDNDAMNFGGIFIPEGEKGRLIGDANNPKVLTPTTPDLVNKFQAKVKVGTNGAFEKGLSSSLKAITPPLVTADNAGFLRYEANLAIVVVTDAADQSTEPVANYLNRFLNVKGFNRANMFTFNVIGPFAASPASGCTYDDIAPDDGRYQYMVTQTNGVKDEVCAPNWAQKLQDLGKTAFGFRTTFFLNAPPDLTNGRTLEVKVDGATSTAWTYDPVANAVKFDAAQTPGPGQTLSVTYYVACL
ncbi:MAG: choice-of-anchor D domain-containing protein [Myxococcota bacterium]